MYERRRLSDLMSARLLIRAIFARAGPATACRPATFLRESSPFDLAAVSRCDGNEWWCAGPGSGPGPLQPLTMRIKTPPPGRAKPFHEWAIAIVARTRDYLPDIRAVRKGSTLVIIRHGEREARLSMDGSSSACWTTFTSTTVATTMAPLFDDRRDDFAVMNLAHTITHR